MLVEMAIADAYGAAFEFMSDTFIARENDLSGYKRNPETLLGDGRYTDHTQMTIAISEHLISGDVFSAQALSDRFVKTFKRDKRHGYSKRLFNVLDASNNGGDFLGAVQPISVRSGAAMRVSPLGLLPDLSHVLELAEFQASITHNTPEGRMSAAAVATMVHYLAYKLGPRQGVGRFVEAHVTGYSWSDPWVGRVDMSGISCAHAAIQQVENALTLSQLLIGAIYLGGDTDTVAAISMFSASLCEDIKADLPIILFDNLENGPYGLDFLRLLDSRLVDLANGMP